MRIEEMLLTQITEEDFIRDYQKIKYVPVVRKYEIADTIAKICVEEDELSGLLYEHTLYKRVLPIYYILREYTTIEFSEKDGIIETYDLISEYEHTPVGKILSNICQTIPDSYEIILMVDEIIEGIIESNNGVGAVIAKFMKKIASQIPSEKEMNDVINKTKTTFENFDPAKLTGILGVIEKITPTKE